MPKNNRMILKREILNLVVLILFISSTSAFPQEVALVIHGGAGNIYKENIPDSLEGLYREKLSQVLRAGYSILIDGGTSQEAVKKAINIMEDSPLFNAGKGSVFANSGANEMDASIMNGATLNSGAVAGVKHIKNPINAAIEVMNNSPHVMMTGEGAETFAKSKGVELVDATYFYTEKRYEQLLKVKKQEAGTGGSMREHERLHKFGTVGAVCPG